MPIKSKKDIKFTRAKGGINIVIKNEYTDQPEKKQKRQRRRNMNRINQNRNFTNSNANQVVDSKIPIPHQNPLSTHQALALAGLTPDKALSILPPPPPSMLPAPPAPPPAPGQAPLQITFPDPNTSMMQMFMNMMKPQHYTNNPYTMITEMNDPIYQAISDPEQQQQYLENQTQEAIQTEVQKVQTNPTFSSLTI